MRTAAPLPVGFLPLSLHSSGYSARVDHSGAMRGAPGTWVCEACGSLAYLPLGVVPLGVRLSLVEHIPTILR